MVQWYNGAEAKSCHSAKVPKCKRVLQLCSGAMMQCCSQLRTSMAILELQKKSTELHTRLTAMACSGKPGSKIESWSCGEEKNDELGDVVHMSVALVRSELKMCLLLGLESQKRCVPIRQNTKEWAESRQRSHVHGPSRPGMLKLIEQELPTGRGKPIFRDVDSKEENCGP